MDSISRDVAEIEPRDREALEHVLGRSLADDQRVVISVTPATQPRAVAKAAPPLEIPAWWKIYEGLSDEEIDRLDQSIRQRANLTRSSD
ncbi:MAG: hypothetical protein ACR2FY_18925 [Pirellulaceae bacterium]